MSQEVLVVEDNDDIATLLIHSVEREGRVAKRVSRGAAAVALVARRPPALVILDLGLPDMDGVDVCRALRSSGFEGGVLMVTARAEASDRALGLSVGADDYLPKPFRVAELQARIRALLDRGDAPLESQAARVTRIGLDLDIAN